MELICQIKEVYKSLYLFEREFADQHQISISEAMLLCCLQDGEPRPAKELADYIGLSNSRVSRIIGLAEERGYITRQMGAKDRRNMIFSLTSKGVAKAEELRNKVSLEEFLQRIIPKGIKL